MTMKIFRYHYDVSLHHIHGFHQSEGVKLRPQFEDFLRHGFSQSPFDYEIRVVPDGKTLSYGDRLSDFCVNVVLSESAFNALFSFYIESLRHEDFERYYQEQLAEIGSTYTSRPFRGPNCCEVLSQHIARAYLDSLSYSLKELLDPDSSLFNFRWGFRPEEFFTPWVKKDKFWGQDSAFLLGQIANQIVLWLASELPEYVRYGRIPEFDALNRETANTYTDFWGNLEWNSYECWLPPDYACAEKSKEAVKVMSPRVCRHTVELANNYLIRLIEEASFTFSLNGCVRIN